MKFGRLPPEAVGRVEALAGAIRSTLRSAGLTVGAPEAGGLFYSGVDVGIDTGDDAQAGVYVSWCVSEELSAAVQPAFREGRFDEAEVQFYGAVNELARDFLLQLLRRAGFDAREAHEFQPFSVHVRLDDSSATSR
jgi:hypothetical protein